MKWVLAFFLTVLWIIVIMLNADLRELRVRYREIDERLRSLEMESLERYIEEQELFNEQHVAFLNMFAKRQNTHNSHF